MNFQQQPHSVLMIRPKNFGFNPATAGSNVFQSAEKVEDHVVLAEFDRMVDLLRAHEIRVEVIADSPDPVKPDAVFPNNWISFHEDGKVVLYPMMSVNRRWERRNDIIELIKTKFVIKSLIDLSAEEEQGKFLEGTGSVVYDHVNRIAYACRSPRTDEVVFRKLCKAIHYTPVIFDAVDEHGRAIYHTNVMMSVCEKFCMLCIDSIRNEADQDLILASLASTAHKVISISYEQMIAFAGNVLEVKNQEGENFVLISQTAMNSLLPGQVHAITQFAEVLPISIPNLERIGGGSVRCMVAGIHLPVKSI